MSIIKHLIYEFEKVEGYGKIDQKTIQPIILCLNHINLIKILTIEAE
jgi:hypothetical protein